MSKSNSRSSVRTSRVAGTGATMRLGVVVLALVSVARPAVAQDVVGDWDIYRDQRARTTLAYTQFSNGLGLGFRCQAGSFSAVVSGLPRSGDKRRTIRLRFGNGEAYETGWTSTTEPTVAVADMPAPMARNSRLGGPLRLTLPGAAEGGRDLTYALQLPPSAGAIDEALSQCGKPLVDPRDAELEALPADGIPRDLTWQIAPRPRFPDGDYALGFAAVSCIADPNGRARDCVVESEHPHDGRFGRAILDAMSDARLVDRINPNRPIRPTRIAFRADFRIEGFESDRDLQERRANRRRDSEQRRTN